MVDALRKAGARVEAHGDHFADDAPDEEWLILAGTKEWVVLTKDSLRKRPIEMRALSAARLRAIILTRRNLSGDEMAAMFVAYLGAMIRMCQREPPPFVAALGGSGLRISKRARDLR